MVRKDYHLLETALGDSLYQIRHNKRLTKGDHIPEIVFWYTVETVSDYLQEQNKAFDADLFKEEILRVAEIGEQVDEPTHEDFLRDCLGLKLH